jgi:CHAT domain-containing protein
LWNDVIRPGAEYLGLVRGLRTNELSLKLHLLLEANVDTLSAAIEEFRPTVVHFICHGDVSSAGAGFLELTDPQDPSKSASVYGPSLIGALRTKKNLPLPQIVVLNACYTAAARFWKVGQVASPLSVELLQSGVPVVVGMAGRVADQACRLFTRGFYESLLTQGEIAVAAGEGRRAGIRCG